MTYTLNDALDCLEMVDGQLSTSELRLSELRKGVLDTNDASWLYGYVRELMRLALALWEDGGKAAAREIARLCDECVHRVGELAASDAAMRERMVRHRVQFAEEMAALDTNRPCQGALVPGQGLGVGLRRSQLVPGRTKKRR